ELHRRVYDERLARASEARKEVEIAAGNARSDFHGTVVVWQNGLVTPRRRVEEAFGWLRRFREIHRLERPVHEHGGMLRWVAIALGLIVLESILNGAVFAQKNEFGLLGGALVALLVSVVNVGVSSLCGYFSRNANHRNWLRKFFGAFLVLAWIGFASGFNLGVAHFRDAVLTLPDWNEAARVARDSLVETPFGIGSIESWLLVGFGLLVSFFAALKGYHADDPYPDYGRVDRAVVKACDTYATQVEAAVEQLLSQRDAAIAELRDASEEVRRGIGEAVDALFGQSSLRSHLTTFLDQCDLKANLLLSIYRDANRAARSTPAPGHFDRPHAFPAFVEAAIEPPRKIEAEREQAQVAALIDATVRAIFDDCRHSIDAYRSIDALAGRAAPVAPPAPGPAPREEAPAADAAPLAVVSGGWEHR
ncbi:MAG TPA: hypothetical protein VFR34_11010, partial [Paracoccaceae bacterium]|nr:hypothetical protein [Paracoccaceae bacterium]